METITTRKQAIAQGSKDGLAELDLYYETAARQDQEGNGEEEAREAAEITLRRGSELDGESAAHRKVSDRWRQVYFAAYQRGAKRAAARYLAK